MSAFTEARLGDLASAVTITRGFPTQRTVPDGDIPVMSVADLRNDSAPRHFADLDAIDEAGLSLAQPGDVLVAIEGGTVGETIAVGEGLAQFVPSQQVAILRVTDTTELDPWYLGAWFATEQARDQLRRLARGAGIQRIPIREVASVTVKLPMLSQQREIGSRFVAFETAIKAHRAVAACLEDLRDLDMVVAFSDAADRAAHSTHGPHGEDEALDGATDRIRPGRTSFLDLDPPAPYKRSKITMGGRELDLMLPPQTPELTPEEIQAEREFKQHGQ
jgi:hypothetical protein